MNMIVDAHSDLLLELAFRSHEENPFLRHWLLQLRDGGVKIQVCPVMAQFEHLGEGALRQALEQVLAGYRALRENPEEVALIKTSADLDHVRQSERIGLILSMEGAEPFGYSTELAEVFWLLGVRMFALTWNRRNPFADGIGETGGGGLSQLGRALVRQICALGGIIDLAHASERTFFDVLDEIEDKHPVVVSHAACRAVLDSPRNLSDDQLAALAERDGVVGIMAVPWAVDEDEPSIDRVVDHIDHAVGMMGIEHVGLGADFYQHVALSGAARKPPDSMRPAAMGMEDAIDGLAGPADYPKLASGLVDRGYGDRELDAILGANFLRLLRAGLPDGRQAA
jgi:membrane dipeptidase